MCYSVVSLSNEGKPARLELRSPSADGLVAPNTEGEDISYGGPVTEVLPDESVHSQLCFGNSNSFNGQTNVFAELDHTRRNVPQSAEVWDPTHDFPASNFLVPNRCIFCLVCGDNASGVHYGVASCEACRSFFRRSVKIEARYSCRGNRCCIIDAKSKNRCQYCRLSKCISAGMKRDAVHEETRLNDKQGHQMRSADMTKGLLSQPDGALNSRCAEEERGNSHTSTSHLAECGNVNVAEVLLGAELPKTNGNALIQLDSFLDSMKTSVPELIKWAQRIPVFACLDLVDQVRLLGVSWCELYILSLVAENGSNFDTLVRGMTFSSGEIENAEIHHIVDRILNEVALSFETLSVDPLELACLMIILLFNAGGPLLSAKAQREVNVYQDEILVFLENHSKVYHPTTTSRFSKLLLRLASVQAISKDMTQYLEVQHILGHTQMDQLLLELLDAR